MDNSVMVSYIIPIAVLIILSTVVISIVVSLLRKNRNQNLGQDQKTLLAEANKRLANNPKDRGALKIIADIHYDMGNFEKAMKTYRLLLDSAALDTSLDDFEINLNYGLACLQCKAHKEAYKALAFAREKHPNRFEINASLGKLEYLRKSYEKSINFLKKAIAIQPDHDESLKYYGQALFKLKKYREAQNYLKQRITSHPEDKEAVFSLACCYYELSQHDLALKFFTHLRADPQLGPNSTLYSGTIYQKRGEYDKAATDYGIGLRHEAIPPSVNQELLYRQASAFNHMGDLPNALSALNSLSVLSPGYKDIDNLIKKYTELNNNKRLQLYLRASVSDFNTLCRQLSNVIIPDAKIKVVDITVSQNNFVDMLTEVRARKWEDVILFRFGRTEGHLGELSVRELYAHMKEVHAGRGFYLTPGNYSTESSNFVEARLIDLIDKSQLLKLLNKLDK
jgi:tetratricopeptide (TPR) repeat protein